jgi:hypothetical protein
MNDDELRSRIAATDPMHDGVSTKPIDSAEAQSLLEAIVNIQLDEPDTRATEPTTPPTSRSRWFAPALAVAAAAVIAVGGAAVGGVFDGGGDSEPSVLALSTGDVDPVMMSCLAPDASVLTPSPVAFRAVVDTVEGEQVTMSVDTWYKGGDADVVELTAPAGMEALIGGLDFVPGETYLVSANDGVVNYCGLTGPATPELQAMYDEAFPG